MAKTQAASREKQYTDEPPSLGSRAIDNLQFIRDTMERSTHFTAVPGYGAILMGVTAIGAAYIAHNSASIRDWWITWIAEAFLAFAIGLLAMWQKSKLANTSLTSVPAKKFAMSFLPPLVCGIVCHARLMAVRPLRVDGPDVDTAVRRRDSDGRRIFGEDRTRLWAGVLSRWERRRSSFPPGDGNIMMALTFGLLHIVGGFIIARRYGG